MYKRLSTLRTDTDRMAIEAELKDRYGPWPEPVQHLLDIVALKVLARRLKIHKLDLTGEGILIAFDPARPLPDDKVRRLLSNSDQRIQLISEFSVKLRLTETEQSQWPALFLTTRNYLQTLL